MVVSLIPFSTSCLWHSRCDLSKEPPIIYWNLCLHISTMCLALWSKLQVTRAHNLIDDLLLEYLSHAEPALSIAFCHGRLANPLLSFSGGWLSCFFSSCAQVKNQISKKDTRKLTIDIIIKTTTIRHLLDHPARIIHSRVDTLVYFRSRWNT